ncbi:MAG: hypothetical protein WCR52_22755 [Bacteroidota bacterium]
MVNYVAIGFVQIILTIQIQLLWRIYAVALGFGVYTPSHWALAYIRRRIGLWRIYAVACGFGV